MKLCEFAKRYNLHDSLLERIVFDEAKKTAELTIDFCCWQQPDYKENDPETGLVTLLFVDITKLDRDEHSISSDEIVQCTCLDDNTLALQVRSDMTGNCHTIVISAGAVSII